MTEQEWLTCDDPQRMLHCIVGSAQGHTYIPSSRKLCLFAVACANWLGATNPGPYGKDGEKIDDPMACAYGWSRPEVPIPPQARADFLREIIGNPFRPVVLPVGEPMQCEVCEGSGEWEWSPRIDRAYKICQTCHGAGTITVQCRWLIPTVLSLAETAYQERQDDGTLDPCRLAVLADALEEAGCTNDDILRHLRGFEWCPSCWGTEEVSDDSGGNPGRVRWCYECMKGWVAITGPHVRGCWALDLVLGKE